MASGNITIAGTNEVLFGAGLSGQAVTAPGVGYGNFFIDAGGNGFEDQIASSGTYNAQMTQAPSGLFIMQIVALAQSTIVATPTFAPGAGTYTASQSVTISTSTTGSTLLYCTDSTNTCTPSTTYTVPITVSSNEYIRAQGTHAGDTSSAIASAQYFIAPVITTPTFSPPAGAITAGTTVTFSSSGFSPTFCSRIGSAPTTNGNGNCTSGTAGNSVIITSTETVYVIATQAGKTDSAVASAAYTISSPQVAQPTLTPSPSGIYYFPLTLTANTATSGAGLCYLLNSGSTPAGNGSGGCATGTFLANGGTLFFPDGGASQVLKIVGVKSGYTDSVLLTTSSFQVALLIPGLSPSGGYSPTSVNVTITSPSSGVTLCWTNTQIPPTTDGNGNCTGASNTLTNGGTISLSRGQVIEVVATKSGAADSLLVMGLYLVNPSHAPVVIF